MLNQLKAQEVQKLSFTQSRSHQTFLSSKPGVRYDARGIYNVKQLIKRQLMSKTTSKHQQITMAHAATGTDDKEHHLCRVLLAPSSSSLLDVGAGRIQFMTLSRFNITFTLSHTLNNFSYHFTSSLIFSLVNIRNLIKGFPLYVHEIWNIILTVLN